MLLVGPANKASPLCIETSGSLSRHTHTSHVCTLTHTPSTAAIQIGPTSHFYSINQLIVVKLLICIILTETVWISVEMVIRKRVCHRRRCDIE